MFKSLILKNFRLYITIIVALLCLGGIAVAIYEYIQWQEDSNQINNQIDEINKIVQPVELEATNNESIKNPPINDEDPYWDYIKMSMIDVDFTELKKINTETKGWIQVLGTNINYPFVQHNDNEFYLNHSFNQKENRAGWVFLDYRNNINIPDRNNIIYAHGRVNTVLFGTLKNLTQRNWYSNPNNYIIKISTEKSNTLWQVFSVYRLPTTSDYLVTTFNTDETFLNFLNFINERSEYDFKTTLFASDKIVTLSTCYSSDEKVVMHAKLIRQQEK